MRLTSRQRARKGQAELIGGLIILTILLVIVMPMLINSYTDTTRLTEQARSVENRVDLKLKERLTIQGVRQEDVGPDLWPAIWVNNTGTVQVTLRTLYLIDTDTGRILAAIDLANGRPTTSTLINEMYLNPDPGFTTSDPLPPVGTPITLKPGDHLFIVFNSAHPAMANPEKIIVRILSSEGVLHPQAGGGESQGELVPPAQGGTTEFEPWKGAFNPYAGFKMVGSELLDNGVIKAFRPRIILTSPIDTRFYSTFIYDDDAYPGLYKITLEPRGGIWIATNYGYCYAWSGSDVEIKGFLGTYHFYTSSGYEYVYINGYATQILVDGSDCFGDQGLRNIDPTGTYEISDFDANGVDELVFYTLRNGPNYGYSSNPNADGVGNAYDDAIVWSYMATRDISGQDFIRITVKINYYWTKTALAGSFLSPARDLRTFMVAVWEYNPSTDSWILRHYKDFSYTSEKPKQYQFSAVFPLNSTKTYRVGVLFFDNYRIIEEDGADDTSLEFTYAIEYLVVEYGRYNPLFSTTPPVYIVAIPDPNKIRNIGENEYATLYSISVLDARVQAQAELLSMVRQSLEDAGLTDYVVITSTSELCNLLFSTPTSGLPDTPPKRAVIIWLQGDMDISTVSGGCADNNDLKSYVENYHWVFAQISGNPLWGSLSTFTGSGSAIAVYTGTELLNITDEGAYARLLYKAFKIPIEAEFAYTLAVYSTGCKVANATFYHNVTYVPERYGTLGFWSGCNPDPASSGIYVVNPVDIDWAQDGGGVIPEAVAEIVTYAALEAYKYLAP